MPSNLKYQRSGSAPPAAEDVAEIEGYAASKGMRVISLAQNLSPWPYWLRGKLFLSNIARIFIATAEDPNGRRHQIHLAINGGVLGRGRELQVLLEKDVS